MEEKKGRVADRDEILRFYTGVMRGRVTGGGKPAAVADRLRAANALLSCLEAGAGQAEALERLDRMLEETRRAADREAE